MRSSRYHTAWKGSLPRTHGKRGQFTSAARREIAFKAIEFNKDAKRIIVSHSRIHEDASGEETRRRGRRGGKKETSTEVAAAMPVIEKATLGDIEELPALKEKLDNQKLKALKKKQSKRQKKPRRNKRKLKPKR